MIPPGLVWEAKFVVHVRIKQSEEREEKGRKERRKRGRIRREERR